VALAVKHALQINRQLHHAITAPHLSLKTPCCLTASLDRSFPNTVTNSETSTTASSCTLPCFQRLTFLEKPLLPDSITWL
jgi:hypothetical protein